MNETKVTLALRREVATLKHQMGQLEQLVLDKQADAEFLVDFACAFAFTIGLGMQPLTQEEIRSTMETEDPTVSLNKEREV